MPGASRTCRGSSSDHREGGAQGGRPPSGCTVGEAASLGSDRASSRSRPTLGSPPRAQGADRQPRRDCRPGRPRLPRRRPRIRSGVRRARPRRPARPGRRRGLRPRRDHPGRLVPAHRQGPQGARGLRRRRRAPRLRLPVGERRVRPGRDRHRRHLDRPVAGGDRRPRRQDHGPAHRPADRGAAGGRYRRPGQGRRRGAGVRPGARPAGGHQGGVRRRRSRPEDRAYQGRGPGAVRVGRP